MGYIQDLVNQGYGGYAGWGETEAKADITAGHKEGKRTSGGTSSGGFDAGAYAREQQSLLEAREAKQRKVDIDFNAKFRAAVQGIEPMSAIRERVIGERFPEYTGLKEGAYAASEALRDIPSDVRTRAGQVGMAENRIKTRITSKMDKIAPFVQDALSKMAFLEEQVSQAFQLEASDVRDKTMLPLQQEMASISDRLQRELTGYTATMQNQTSMLIQELANRGTLEVQKLKDLSAAAIAEQQYFSSEIITADGRRKLVDKRTGELIADLGASGTTGNGNGNIEADIDNELVDITGAAVGTGTGQSAGYFNQGYPVGYG